MVQLAQREPYVGLGYAYFGEQEPRALPERLGGDDGPAKANSDTCCGRPAFSEIDER